MGELWPIAGVSLVLLLAALGLLGWHIRAWESFRGRQADAAEYNYRRRQFRRRVQTSAMLGLVAVALGLGMPLTKWVAALWFGLAYWLVVVLLVVWMVLLALIDAWSSRIYYGRLRHQSRLEEIKLQAEIRRLRAAGGNGEAGSNTEPAPSGKGTIAAQRAPHLGAGPLGDHQRHDAQDEGERGHHDRPQAQLAGLQRGLAARRARLALGPWRTRRSGWRSCRPGRPARRSRSA